MEFCNKDDLAHYMRANKIEKFEEAEAIKILKQLVEEFKELHKRNIIHMNIKLDNIFINGA